ncbi:hypothetical protein AAFF_G00152790 [Aldrovandia affinis]|uniref:ribonuclease H n=1 Tax=Aldrovandia affinis TaxID=143900 RepID=A0AAD7W8P9_9TELE|nr:hypothetical protein AAFF_G00152790 [Aldrovandia affinis]
MKLTICFRHLPLGITSAPEIFQNKMSELLRDLEGVCCFMDDVLVHGCTQEDHDRRLAEVYRVIQASGLKLNKEKCLLHQSELAFVGHWLSHRESAQTQKKSALFKI